MGAHGDAHAFGRHRPIQAGDCHVRQDDPRARGTDLHGINHAGDRPWADFILQRRRRDQSRGELRDGEAERRQAQAHGKESDRAKPDNDGTSGSRRHNHEPEPRPGFGRQPKIDENAR